MGLKSQINRIYARHPKHPFDALWKWGTRRKRKVGKRFAALEEWAHRHAKYSADHNNPKKWQFWHEKEVMYREKKEQWRRNHQPSPSSGWPDHMTIVELYNNDNGLHNHLHVASPDRNELIQLGNIAVAQYGGAGLVREFPPFDPVECVHVGTSWHYRDSSNPFSPRDCAHRGDGCAFDLGSASRDQFGRDIKARYGAQSCDF